MAEKNELLRQLDDSIAEEEAAIEAYRRRADYARRGYPTVAILYDHIREEEECHIEKLFFMVNQLIGVKEAKEYPYHATAYGYEGEVLETDDFQDVPSLAILATWAVNISKKVHGREGGYGPGLKMAVDKIVIIGPNFHQKWSRWELFK